MIGRKYIKKPVVIEAMQWTGENTKDLFNFYGKKAPHNNKGITIKTLEGNMKLKKGNYLIKGISGEFYPCDNEIFKQTYEPVE